uniref:Uncharacterized protein n=1 Tax=Siphoviridae sp. ctzyE57 TaxID=2827982 RepID=A0A8S5SHG0_9CAUD|nr:MAG TPA: hypothetical protein [Siphoviridae sp. ctzyE57]
MAVSSFLCPFKHVFRGQQVQVYSNASVSPTFDF